MAVPSMIELMKELNDVCEKHRSRCTTPEELSSLFETITRSCIGLGASIGAAYVCRTMDKFPDENMPILSKKLMDTLNQWADSLDELAPSKN